MGQVLSTQAANIGKVYSTQLSISLGPALALFGLQLLVILWATGTLGTPIRKGKNKVLSAIPSSAIASVLTYPLTKACRPAAIILRLPNGPVSITLFGKKVTDPLSLRNLEKLKERYGDIATLWTATTWWRPTIIVSDAETAKEMFEDGGNTFNSRPRFALLNEVFGDGQNRSMVFQALAKPSQPKKAIKGSKKADDELTILGLFTKVPEMWLMFKSTVAKTGWIRTYVKPMIAGLYIAVKRQLELYKLEVYRVLHISPQEQLAKLSAKKAKIAGKSVPAKRKLLVEVLDRCMDRGTFKERQQAEAAAWVFGLVSNRQVEWEHATDKFAASSIFSVVYGRRIANTDSKILEKKVDFDRFSTALAARDAYAADTKKAIREKGEQELAFNIELLSGTNLKTKNNGGGNLASMFMDETKNDKSWMQGDMSSLPSSLVSAGMDSISSTIKFGVLAIITNKEARLAAEEELHRVVGSKRTPSFRDLPKLPYIMALTHEVLRYRPVMPLGVPHATLKKTEYKAQGFARGTEILANIWGMNHDEEYFRLPEVFNPARFLPNFMSKKGLGFKLQEEGDTLAILKGDDELKTFPYEIGHAVFGWGKRACPGAALTVDLLAISFAKLIWACDMSPIEGQVYDELDIVSSGLIQRPASFPYRFTCRSSAHYQAMKDEESKVETDLRVYPAFE